MRKYDFDLFTIGAGSGGVRALAAAPASLRRAGGHRREEPGRRHLRDARLRAEEAAGLRRALRRRRSRTRAASAGASTTPRLDWATLIDTKNRELDRLEGIYRGILRGNDVQLLEAHGRSGRPAHGRGRRQALHRREHPDRHRRLARRCPNIPGIEHAITSNEALDLPDAAARAWSSSAAATSRSSSPASSTAPGAEVTEIIRGDRVAARLRRRRARLLARRWRSAASRILPRDASCARSRRPTTAWYRRVSPAAATLEADARDVRDRPHAQHARPRPRGGRRQARRQRRRRGRRLDRAAACRTSTRSATCTDRINLTPVAIAEGRAFAETLFNDNPIQRRLRQRAQPRCSASRRSARSA